MDEAQQVHLWRLPCRINMALDLYNLAVELYNLSFELHNIAVKSINMAFASDILAIDKILLTNIKFSSPPKTFQETLAAQHSSQKNFTQKRAVDNFLSRCSSCYPLSCAFACSSSAFNTFEWAFTTSSSVNVRSGSS